MKEPAFILPTLWMSLPFGKYRGKTLPQVMLLDPDWFFWACDERIFQTRKQLSKQAMLIAERARRIRVHGVVHIQQDHRGRIADVTVTRGQESGLIDLSLARGLAGGRDKTGSRILVEAVRVYVFGGNRLTRKRCEAFFDDANNFAGASKKTSPTQWRVKVKMRKRRPA